MRKTLCVVLLLVIFFGSVSFPNSSIEPRIPKRPLKIGYSVSLNSITKEKLQHAKSVGIDFIEIGGCEELIDANLNFIFDDNDIKKKFYEVKEILKETGIKVWSIHMPGIASFQPSAPREEGFGDLPNKLINRYDQDYQKLLSFVRDLLSHNDIIWTTQK